MQNAGSGARKQRGRKSSGDAEVLTPAEAAKELRGQILKRYVRAAAAMNDLFDDKALAKEIGISRGAVLAWWTGSRPSGPTIFRLAAVTGLSSEELTRFVYDDGPEPVLPDPAHLPVLEGARRGQARQDDEAPDTPSQPPAQRPRGSGAGRG